MSVKDAKQYHTDQVHYLQVDTTFGPKTVSLGWLPPGSTVMDAGAYVETAFNAATTNTVSIGFRNAGDGTADSATEIASGVSIGTVGMKDANNLGTSGKLKFRRGAEIFATIAETGAAATAGAAEVFLTYRVRTTSPLPELA